MRIIGSGAEADLHGFNANCVTSLGATAAGGVFAAHATAPDFESQLAATESTNGSA